MQSTLVRNTARIAGAAMLALLSGCAATRVGMAIPANANEVLLKGPAVMDVSTPFDRALTCLDGRINRDVLRFSVGAIVDATGKEQVTDGGSGKFVTQGAGDIVQSALFKAGASVVNRRDPRIIENDIKWGLLNSKQQEATTFFVTGSINSLDFLPGSGFDMQIAGVGPRYRQNRILVGLDLSLTEARTGKIVANVPLQKQVVATEDGFGIGRFFGSTLISLDIGGKEREALNLVLRQMLNLATFELLTQVMNPSKYGDCMALIDSVDGVTDNSLSKRKLTQYLAEQQRAAQLAQRNKTSARPASQPDVMEKAGQSAAGAKTVNTPQQPQARTEANSQPAGTAVAGDPNAAAADQSAYFRDEQAGTSPAALKALAISGSARVESPRNGSGGGTSVLAAALGNGAETEATSSVTSVPVCDFPAGEFPQVTPLRATQPGNKLQVRSRSAQVLCLADASGIFAPRPLPAGVEQQFNGKAPWKLQAERMSEIEIVFQGLPLRKPGYVKDRLELLERS